MFNPLTPADVVLAIGRVTGKAARGKLGDSGFAQSQFFFADSTARHLSAEIDSYGPALRLFVSEVVGAAGDTEGRGAVSRLVADLSASEDAREIADATSALLAELRRSGSGESAQFRAFICSRMRWLADQEVDSLAKVVEDGKAS